ncbi:MAG: O-antigen ligase family protein [Bacteroidetes bacterium]|nr:O-antigen ligase family protein [Bacteroidota bacterium]
MAAKTKNAKTPQARDAGILFNVFFIFLILILPLVFFQTAQDSSLLPRMLILTTFLLGFSVYLIAFYKGTLPDQSLLKNPVFVFGGLYLIMTVLSLAAAVNRSEGLFDMAKTGITLLVAFYAAHFFSTTAGWFTRLSNLAVIAVLAAVAIGFYQFFTQVPGHEQERLANGREMINVVKGLMGNKNEYASYLLLLLPFTLYAAVFGKAGWRKMAMASTAFLFIMLILVETRAAWLGIFMAGCTVMAIVLIIYKKLGISSRQVKIAMIVVSSVVVLVAAGVVEGGKFTHSKYLEKLGSILRPEAGNNHFRLNTWKITAEMAMDHPVAGVGAGNWQIVIPEYFSRVGFKDKDVNWISPHNDYLWILSEKGFIGLALYLGMILAAAWLLIRIFRSQADKTVKWQALFLCAGLTAYLTVAFFDFPYQRIDHQVLFALMIGGLLAIDQHQNPVKPLPVSRNFFFIPVIAFLGFGLFYSTQALKVETHVKMSQALMNAGRYNEAIAEINQARTPFRSLDAKGSPVDYYAAMIYEKMNDNQTALISNLAALANHPNHNALLNNLGKCYYAAGYYGLAEHYYLKALKIVPGYKEARVNLSTLYYVKGNYQASYDMLNGIKGGGRMPAIKQNKKELRKLLGVPEDTAAKTLRHKNKLHKKDKQKKLNKSDKPR